MGDLSEGMPLASITTRLLIASKDILTGKLSTGSMVRKMDYRLQVSFVEVMFLLQYNDVSGRDKFSSSGTRQ
jgi:hypothetical protein